MTYRNYDDISTSGFVIVYMACYMGKHSSRVLQDGEMDVPSSDNTGNVHRPLAGMEAVLQTTNQEEIEQAVAAGASIISVVGKQVEEAMELRQYIPESVSEWGAAVDRLVRGG